MDKTAGSWESRGLRSTCFFFFFFNVVRILISFDDHAVNILIIISLKQILERKISFSRLCPLLENAILMD